MTWINHVALGCPPAATHLGKEATWAASSAISGSVLQIITHTAQQTHAKKEKEGECSDWNEK